MTTLGERFLDVIGLALMMGAGFSFAFALMLIIGRTT